MDFRNCPACKASVLEDDAEDCPFCGASMSGKPSATPAKKPAATAAKAAPAAAKAQASAGAAAKAPAKSKSQAAPKPLDDGSDPFEVDTRTVVKAPPVRPKPAKGRMLRVVCPMCETPGFISPKLQGMEVKCCNPDCMMPIFKAPKPKEKPPEEEPKRSTASIVFAVSAVVLLLAVGFGLYHFVLKDEISNDPTTSETPAATANNGPIERNLIAEPETTDAPQVTSLDEIRDTSLAEVEKAAQQRADNRSKPFGRRMAAEAYAGAGLLDQAREQLADMRKVPGYVKYYEIDPLVMIAQRLRQQGDAAGAEKTLDDALSKADLPAHGREPLDAASRLATALMVAGRADEARGVAKRADDSGTRGRAFVLWRFALDSGSLDLNGPARRPCLHDMPSAQWVSVTLALLAQDRADDALAWARSAEDEAARDNALAVWAAGLAAASASPGETAAPAAVTAVIDQLSPTAQARIWAAIADMRQSQGNTTAMQQSLANATAALAQVAVPEKPRAVPSLKEIYESDGQPRAGLPDPAQARSAALAAADIAQVQAAAGNIDAAWKSMQRALAFLRGTAPSPVATQALLDEDRDSRLNPRLQSALGIESDRVFLAGNRYLKQCKVLHEEATSRFNLQVSLLRRAAAFGVLDPLWAEVVERDRRTDPAEREAYLDTLLPGTVYAYATAAQNADLARRVQETVPRRQLRVDARDQLVIRFGQQIDVKDFRTAADLLRAYEREEPGDYYTSHTIALRGVSRLIKAGGHLEAMDLVREVLDPLLREDAVQLIAAAAVRDDNYSELWERRAEYRLSATEKASFYRGCIRGLNLRPASAAESVEGAE